MPDTPHILVQTLQSDRTLLHTKARFLWPLLLTKFWTGREGITRAGAPAQYPDFALPQAIGKLTASLSALGVNVVVSDGAPQHIDFIDVAEVPYLLGAAAKSYVDWYMLTQVRVGKPSYCLQLQSVATKQAKPRTPAWMV